MSETTNTPAAPQGGGVSAGSPSTAKPTLLHRVRDELAAFLLVSAYLFVWFSSLLFYKAAILRSHGVDFAPLGLAIVKALILGKFILVLEALRVGDRNGGAILALSIVRKTLLFTALLVVMSIVEDLLVGMFHGRSAGEVLREIGGGSVAEALASAILLCLVLLPYFAFRRLVPAGGELGDLLWNRPEPAAAHTSAHLTHVKEQPVQRPTLTPSP